MYLLHLQSANVAYKYGVSGPFWYASGATVQVLLFAILAVEIKRKAPTTHTCLEIVKARWGTTAHIVFLVFCLLTNIIVTSMLILGGEDLACHCQPSGPRRAHMPCTHAAVTNHRSRIVVTDTDDAPQHTWLSMSQLQHLVQLVRQHMA